jgi:hypothetical protein
LKKYALYKCDVVNCENKVSLPGVFCSECFDKIYNNLSSITFCSICRKIIDIEIEEFVDESLFLKYKQVLCVDCNNQKSK